MKERTAVLKRSTQKEKRTSSRAKGSGGSFRVTPSLVIKILLVAILAAYLAALYISDYAKDVSMDQITSSMEASTGITEMQKRGRGDLRRFYSIEEDETLGYLFYKAVSPMSVDECLIVKAANSAGADSLYERVNAHLDSQKNVFGGYGTDQMALLGNASVGKKGNYVYYFCGAGSDSVRDAFFSLI